MNITIIGESAFFYTECTFFRKTIAETQPAQALSLPMYPGLTVEMQDRVVASLARAIAR